MTSSNIGECHNCHAAKAVTNYGGRALCRRCYEANVPSWDRATPELIDPGTGHPVQNTSEDHILVYGSITRAIGIFFSLLFIAVGSLGLQEPSWGVGFAAILWILALVLIAELFLVRITWNDQAVTSEAPWRSPRVIRWSDLSRVSDLNEIQIGEWVRLHSTQSGTLSISAFRSGLDDFIHDVLRFAPPWAVTSLQASVAEPKTVSNRVLVIVAIITLLAIILAYR